MRISTCTLAVLAAVWASASWAVVPNVSDSVIQSQNTIIKDPKNSEDLSRFIQSRKCKRAL